MPEWVDDGGRGPSRRSLLRTAGALLPGLVLGVAGTGAAAAGTASAAGAPRGTFSSPGYSWPASGALVSSGAPATGVVFVLTAPDGRPLPGRRVRFSLSSFHAVRPSLWFEVSEGRKSPGRYGYLDLDTDAEGAVALAPRLRHGAVPTVAVRPVLRAQLVGSETILAASDLSVVPDPRGAR
ncbi:hypothetical protein ASC82_26305 [Streptomyces sp. Root431]|uniref:hypothetical protein n=1 Tax=Streptomyces sp. Root431 TaxID=1736535 RepID=UPI0006F7ECAC|nr:hypothetical protein [Streptomyces sp. Root431]KQX09435.1 hypothetical protein ASC82_26305 [Streptomyces sp. Root431]